jgi:hypothetical protein
MRDKRQVNIEKQQSSVKQKTKKSSTFPKHCYLIAKFIRCYNELVNVQRIKSKGDLIREKESGINVICTYNDAWANIVWLFKFK